MVTRRWQCVLSLPLLLGTAEAAPPEGQPFLIELPPTTLGADVGAGGFVVLGNFFSTEGALTWMPTSGVTPLGGTRGTAISRDGMTIVGSALDANGKENAAIWTGGTEWRLLGSFTPAAQSCDRSLSSSYGTSDDGKVVVGLGWDGCNYAHAFRWEESTGVVDLGSTVADRSSRANNVSGDGRVVVGWQEAPTGPRMGAKWVNGAQELIKGPGGGPVGEAFAVNRDGSLIVGGNCDLGNPVSSAWTWTAANGVQCFPVQPKADIPNVPRQALMMATSDDGRVIGGAFSFGLESESLVWFDGEVFYLKDYLRANGVPDAFEGWVNTGFVLGMTRDGRTLVGYGAGPKTFQGFMVVLPELR
jgi:probable HAF family extracellular repeat protein